MTRFGAMKHLRILEAAGLIATRKVGREKLHYLNPVPIQLIADRWVSKFAAPWASALSAMKRDLEADMIATRPTHVLRGLHPDDARTTLAGDHRRDRHRRYYYGTIVDSTWQDRQPMTYRYPDGTLAAEGTVVEFDPPNRLVTTFHAVWDDETKADRPPG